MNSNYDCKLCGGHKVIPREVRGIAEVCPRCKGKGEIDWITNATGGRVREQLDHQLLHMTLMRNIEILKNEIINQGREAGVMVQIELKFKDRYEYEREYLMRVIPPITMKYEESLCLELKKDLQCQLDID